MTKEGKQQQKKRMAKGDIETLTSYILSLPQNDKGSKDELSIAEIFAPTNDSILLNFAEAFEVFINQKGYGFTEMAQILLEKTGITITPKQLKFHYLRNKKLKENMKLKSGSEQSKSIFIDKKKNKKPSTKSTKEDFQDVSLKENLSSEDNSPSIQEDRHAVVNIPEDMQLPLLDNDEYPNYENEPENSSKEEAHNESSPQNKAVIGEKIQKENIDSSGISKVKEHAKNVKKTIGSKKPGSFEIDMEDKPI
jgi:hypothetical protein